MIQMAERTTYQVAEFHWRINLMNTTKKRIAVLGSLLVLMAVIGCESNSTIDSVMNGGKDSKEVTGVKADEGTGIGFGEMVGGSTTTAASTPQKPSQPPHSDPPKLDPGGSDQKASPPGANGVNSELSDVSTRLDPPKVSRSDFVIRLSIPAREQLLEDIKKPGKSYLLVGKVTPTADDWRHISFVDFYEPDRQFQIRTNGVKILVPRELVNRLHNATIDLDSDTKQYFVTLAR